jgi:UDP-N-acetylglucosamine transferase subunit ALG13
VILVTLGTHPAPMDRLVEAIDGLLETRAIEERVLIQAAAFGAHPRRADETGIAGYETLAAWAHEASAIITHGGPGSIMLALAAGRSPVVVPRLARFGEHVDDHQLKFARWLHERRGIEVVEDMTELGSAIARARRESTHAPARGPSEETITRLRAAIDRSAR